MMELNKVCTFIMPFRIECSERQRNLAFTIEWLASLKATITLLEADVKPKADKDSFPENVEYIFVKDPNPVFHRTHYINRLLKHATTDVVSVWDTDIIVEYQQIEEAVQNIQNGCTLAYPYNGEFVMLSDVLSAELIEEKSLVGIINNNLQPIFNRPSCGGAYFANRKKYLLLGGENEHFTGWGPEDAERLRRVQIMGHMVKWTEEGKAYHLYHPRNENSRFFDEDAAIEMRKELVKVCCMNSKELSEYIKTFNV